MTVSDAEKRICTGICKQYKTKKSAGAGRYGSGQARYQICDIWIDHNGCHVKDGTPAQADDMGWLCNCCNYRVRRKPRNKKYKEKLRYTDAQEKVE